jgi:nucleoside-diphosphate-sugar epimerase
MAAKNDDGLAYVAGATGYVGHEVVSALREKGIATAAHVRPDSARLADWRARFAAMGAAVDATPWEQAAMTATFARLRPRWVFALLGTTRARISALAKHGGDPRSTDYEAVDYGMTVMLIRAAVAASIKPRFVYLSAVGVNPKSHNPYFTARWRAETELRASGLPFVIARPSFITGPDRAENRPTERVAAAALDGVAALAGALGMKGTRARYLSTSGPRLARGLVKAALDVAAGDLLLEGESLQDYQT